MARTRRERAKAWAGAVAGGLAFALGLLFLAAGQALGFLVSLAGFAGLVVALRALRPRVARPGSVPPIDPPPRDALEALEWPLEACPRCGFMDLRWGGPMRLAAECVRCGFAGAPDTFRSPDDLLDHLDALRRHRKG